MSLQSSQTENLKPAIADLFAPSVGAPTASGAVKPANAQGGHSADKAVKSDLNSGEARNSFSETLKSAADSKVNTSAQVQERSDGKSKSVAANGQIDKQVKSVGPEEPEGIALGIPQIAFETVSASYETTTESALGNSKLSTDLMQAETSVAGKSTIFAQNLVRPDDSVAALASQLEQKLGSKDQSRIVPGMVAADSHSDDQLVLNHSRLQSAINGSAPLGRSLTQKAGTKLGTAETGLSLDQKSAVINSAESTQSNQAQKQLAVDALVQQVIRDYAPNSDNNTLRAQLGGLNNFGSLVRQNLTNREGAEVSSPRNDSPMFGDLSERSLFNASFKPIVAPGSPQSASNSLRQSFNQQFALGDESIGNAVDAAEMKNTEGALWKEAGFELNQSSGTGSKGIAGAGVPRATIILPSGFGQQVRAGVDSITLKISPASLGEAKLSLSLVENQLNGSLIVESAAAKAAVEGSLDRLIDRLNQEGLNLDSLDVEVANQQQEQDRSNAANERNAFGRAGKRLDSDDWESAGISDTPTLQHTQVIGSERIDAVA